MRSAAGARLADCAIIFVPLGAVRPAHLIDEIRNQTLAQTISVDLDRNRKRSSDCGSVFALEKNPARLDKCTIAELQSRAPLVFAKLEDGRR